MKKIYSVGIDGLNGSGKGEQIKNLSLLCLREGIPFRVARGDGVRFGFGDVAIDPFSEWWTGNVGFLLDKNSNSIQKLNLQYQRLCREYEALKRRFSCEEGYLGIIILDRSFVSRYFTMKQFNRDISLEDSLTSYNPKNGVAINPIIPERTFILDVPKETLLKRLLKKKDSSEESNRVRREIINTHYALFQSVTLETSKRGDVVVLDGKEKPQDITKRIWEFYKDA